jgi:Arc/MetJ-type ribon-helix-helix transcriptional regulator
MAKKDQIGGAFSDLVGGDKKPKPAKRSQRPIGVALAPDQIAKLDQIAAEIEGSRSDVIRYAIDDLIKRWESGEIKAVTETRVEEVKLLKQDTE